MSKKKRLIFIGVGTLVLLVAAGVGTYFYVFRGDDVIIVTPAQQVYSESTQSAIKASNLNNLINQQNATADAQKQAEELAAESLKAAKTDEEKYDAYIATASVCATKLNYGCAAENYKKAADIKVIYSTTATAAEYLEKSGDKAKALEYYKKALSLVDSKWIEADDMKAFIDRKIKELS